MFVATTYVNTALPVRVGVALTALGNGLIVPFGADAAGRVTLNLADGTTRTFTVRSLLRSQLGLNVRDGSSLAFYGRISWQGGEIDVTQPLLTNPVCAIFEMRANGTVQSVRPALVAANPPLTQGTTPCTQKLFQPGDTIGLHQPIFIPASEAVFEGWFVEKPSVVLNRDWSLTNIWPDSPDWDVAAGRYVTGDATPPLQSSRYFLPSIAQQRSANVSTVGTNSRQECFVQVKKTSDGGSVQWRIIDNQGAVLIVSTAACPSNQMMYISMARVGNGLSSGAPTSLAANITGVTEVLSAVSATSATSTQIVGAIGQLGLIKVDPVLIPVADWTTVTTSYSGSPFSASVRTLATEIYYSRINTGTEQMVSFAELTTTPRQNVGLLTMAAGNPAAKQIIATPGLLLGTAQGVTHQAQPGAAVYAILTRQYTGWVRDIQYIGYPDASGATLVPPMRQMYVGPDAASLALVTATPASFGIGRLGAEVSDSFRSEVALPAATQDGGTDVALALYMQSVVD